MKSLLRTIGIASSLVLTSTVLPAQANAPDYLQDIKLTEDEWLIITSEQLRTGMSSQLALQPGGVGLGETRGEWVFCDSLDDPDCLGEKARQEMLAWSVLEPCAISSTEICLEDFKIGRVGSPLESATYLGGAPTWGTFPGDSEANLLKGAEVPLFESNALSSSAGTNQFYVSVRPSQFWDAKKNQFFIESLEAKITPYVFVSRGFEGESCIFRDAEQRCAVATDFLPDTRLEIKFRIPNSVGGWFSGRMRAPDISISKFNDSLNLITVSSEPVEVSALAVVKKRSEFTPKEEMWLQNNGRFGTNGGWGTGAGADQGDVFEFIENYRKLAKDTSIGSNVVWNMKTSGSGGGSRCLADKSKVLGIVTTNALGYEAASPRFNRGFLEYKVGGLHYKPNGKDLVVGSYDLIIRSDTARCLYKFSRAPLSATVTVTGGADRNIATTIVSEKNGWLKLAAYGFTFSEKTIKVKISKKKKKR